MPGKLFEIHISDFIIIMRLSSVLRQFLLLFLSLQALGSSSAATDSTKPTMVTPFDPCYSYTILDQSWRSIYNTTVNPYLICDYNFNFVGWYRFLLDGQNAQMTEQCIPIFHCGTYVSLHLNGGHPTIADGVVTRNTCLFWNNDCCSSQIIPIRVKACLGGYYVYELVKPSPYCSAYCAEPGIFYSYGPMVENTTNAPSDDGSSSSVQFPTPFLFFGNKHQQIYVNNNGFLTFNQSSSQYDPDSFPAFKNQDIIAGLWTDLDNREKGLVYYRQYINGSILQRATQDINSYFSNLTFNASWVFTATWNKVAYYNLTSTETSFQVVLISGGNYSFILMNYAGIAATEHPVEAGYDTVNSYYYFVIPGSNNGSSITKLNTSSNVNVPGRWAFRVDGESKPIAENTIGLELKFNSYSDMTNTANVEFILQKVRQNLIKKGLPSNIQLKLKKILKINP
ncbi:hypothetical protein DNTS_002228 [Danionella cerebrum]|uniref:NIDO domain-containing protein n=1 Tax=Danionella cerebrum TaxID=2873325 RepID=A0A553NGM8_9TELE|nr:hypothetical protein DNTS_002228 [Danionella translucida]